MKTAVILAAGAGKKVWPYAEIRPKAMIPVANKPIVGHQAELLKRIGFERIIVAVGPMHEQIRHYFRNNGLVDVIEVGPAKGTAFTLAAVKERVGEGPFVVLYGDTVLEQRDVERLIERFERERPMAAALVAPLGDEPTHDWICCNLADGKVANIMGHPRMKFTHRFCAFAFAESFWPYVTNNSGLFTNVQVGMMPPVEGHLEMSLADCIAESHPVPAVEAEGIFVDIDKPWHILTANQLMAAKLCGELKQNELAEGASIDPTAAIDGFVKLGRNSKIGRNVVIRGSIIAGDDTVIENGAILHGDNVIGDRTYVGNYCWIGRGSTVGNRCIVTHCAEMSGVMMDAVHLSHYMEFYGIIGSHTDLGAATVCGTLRFDDRFSAHWVNGRKEMPKGHANASYLGDFSRTGVNAILMPGVKVGVYSVVGAGVILNEDVPNRTLVYAKQELVRKEWGPEKYGW